MRRKKQAGGEKRGLYGLLITLCVLLAVGSCAVIGAYTIIKKQFHTELPEHFLSLTAMGIAPEFFCYRFENRENRIGEAVSVNRSFGFTDETEYVSPKELPKHVCDAFVAIEDKRFYSHRGVDWYRTAAASLNRLLGFSNSFGASTVTQQLVKNLTGNAEITVSRKLQEILYALDLERTLGKEEILTLYLNVIHFSDHCDGIGAAAEHYFSKETKDLTVNEAATLAAIINNPSYYNPIRNPQNNLRRRNLILGEMHTQGMIDEVAYEKAKNQPLGLRVKDVDLGQIHSWYADMVIEDIIGDLCMRYGMTRGAASTLVYSGGLKIYTAVDEEIQKTVEDYYRNKIYVPRDEKGNSAQSALIVIDPKTGDILGVAGAIGEKQGNRIQNFATQTLRAPGSAIKPITVYAQALEKGLINWASVYDDVPVDFGTNVRNAWPHNSNKSYRGLTDISYAMAESTNTVAVKILQEIGLRESFDTAKRKYRLKNLYEENGVTDCDRAALALGQLHYGLTLRELATAYTSFASAGIYHGSRSYYRVLDMDGNILLSNSDEGEVVLSSANAAVMTKLMQGVVENGTASSIKLKNRVECAGKTGSTGQNKDRWFIGYTPELICGVWCGYEYPAPIDGKNPCLTVWDNVMTSIVSQKGGKTRFDVPNSVVKVSYCRDSGKLPCEACAMDPRGGRISEGWFVQGTEPHTLCDCHVICDYDVVCGGVAHENCPADHCQRVALIRVQRDLPYDMTVSDAQYLYHGKPMLTDDLPSDTESYFARTGEGYCGHSNVEKPFNRLAPIHEAPISEVPWWRRYFDLMDNRQTE